MFWAGGGDDAEPKGIVERSLMALSRNNRT